MEISLQEILALCGGSTIIISSIVGYVTQRFADWKNEKWRSETEIKLRYIENELSDKSLIFNSLIEAQKNNYGFAHERRLKAIEETWNGICQFNSRFPNSISAIYNKYQEENLGTLLINAEKSEEVKHLLDDINEIDSNDNFITWFDDMQAKLSSNRPFLGEDLYRSLFTLNLFYSRILLHVATNVYNKKLYHWHYDKILLKVLKGYLSEEEFTFLMKNKMTSLSYTIGVLEDRILGQINKVLTGNNATKTSLEHIKEMRDLINSDYDRIFSALR